MAKAYVFYNPLAGNGQCRQDVHKLKDILTDKTVFCDMTKSETYEKELFSLAPDDYLVLCGGDGTLNRFINLTQEISLKNDILYCPLGSGNDFALDMGHTYGGKPFSIKAQLENLPSVTVQGKTYRFLNGVGYGIDGYCCQEGDRLRQSAEGKTINYTAIAIKGLLFHYKPTAAKVTVDGVCHSYQKVWLAPTMHGRYYGGGMNPAPGQKRNSGTLSVMVMHDSSKLKTLMVFPSIFKGEHVKHTKVVDVFSGREIQVEFDRPTALQIDGETILGVTSYTAHA
ncbi:MAG: diacylglycerol/lipid kinase family protein [Faecousia sp.]